MGKVSIERCSDYSSDTISLALHRTFENLGGIEKYIKPGMKVALKPNLVMRKRPEEAATTHPSLVRELTKIIQNAGGIVTIIDSPGGLYNAIVLKSVYSVCGMEKVAQETGAKLNFDLSVTEADNHIAKYLKQVTILKPLLDADIIINLPKLKTHGQMVYTGAVKNMFGAIPGAIKAEYHLRMANYDDFANVLIDIFLCIKPSLNIMDAVVGMDGYGPTAGNPKQIGLLLAGESAFELDLTALNIVNTDPMLVPIIKHGAARGLCPDDLKHTELVGEDIKDVKVQNFTIPQLDMLKAIQFYDKGILKLLINYMKPKPVFIHKQCIGCSDCARSCPAQIIDMKDKKPKADLSKCIRCFCCQELCPAKAITIKKPFITKFLTRK